MTLDALNALTLFSGVLCFLLIVVKLVKRTRKYAHLRGWNKVPVLLWRDSLLFGAFFIIFGGVVISRVYSLNPKDNPFWVVPTDILGLSAIVFWVYVEYFVVEDPDK